MRGNLLRVDPGIEQQVLDVALVRHQHETEKRLATANGDAHARLLGVRDAVKVLRARVNDDGLCAQPQHYDPNVNLDELFLDEFLDHGLCSLCGNSGIVETHPSSPTGKALPKSKKHCICPNGRTMKALGHEL
jgi:hypothetical protein